VFGHCLSILVFIEDAFNVSNSLFFLTFCWGCHGILCSFSVPQDDLLDLYLYYCVIGMRDTSPALRAACVAMLSVIAVQNTDIVVGIVGPCCCHRRFGPVQFLCHLCACCVADNLVSLQSDTWWEVKAQLLIVSATLLDLLDSEVSMRFATDNCWFLVNRIPLL
jgi:hypothetical protein